MHEKCKQNTPNFILPFIFFEIWYVLLAFVFVVLIETVVIKLFCKKDFALLFKVLLKANFWTTIVGYAAQGIIMLMLGIFAMAAIDISTDNKIINGLVGNGGINYKGLGRFGEPVTVTILTSMLIGLIISIVVERRILIKALHKAIEPWVITGIVIANLLSYMLLFVWVYIIF